MDCLHRQESRRCADDARAAQDALVLSFRCPKVTQGHPKAFDESADYYSLAKNRPLTVIIYRDPMFAPANPIGNRFKLWYRLLQTKKSPLGVLEMYRRR